MAIVSRYSPAFTARQRRHAPSDAGPDALLWAITLMIWTYAWRIQDLFPVLGVLKLHLTATLLSLGLFAIDNHPARRVRLLKTPVLICAVVLLGVAIAGIPMGLWPRNSAMLVLREFIPNLLLMLMVAASIRGMRDLEWIALMNVLGAFIYAVFLLLKFEVGPNARLGDLIYYDANDVALVLVATIPFTIFFLVQARWQYRFVALPALFLFIVTLVKTGSRGGFLGFVAMMGYVVVAYRAIPKRVRLLSVAGAFSLLALVASETYWQTVRTLLRPQQDYNWSGRDTEGRMEVWRRGLRYMAAHPVLGVGLRNFRQAEGLSEESKARMERGAGFKWSAAHNTFLEIGVELGILGLAVFLALAVFSFRALRRIRATHKPNAPNAVVSREVAFASTLSASLIGYLVAGFFVSAAYFSYLYMLLGLTIGLMKVDQLGQRRPAPWPGRLDRESARRQLMAVADVRVPGWSPSAAPTPRQPPNRFPGRHHEPNR